MGEITLDECNTIVILENEEVIKENVYFSLCVCVKNRWAFFFSCILSFVTFGETWKLTTFEGRRLSVFSIIGEYSKIALVLFNLKIVYSRVDLIEILLRPEIVTNLPPILQCKCF